MTIHTFNVDIHIISDKDVEDIKKALKKGIYVGLDSPTYNIAPPSRVEMEFHEHVEQDE